MKYSTYSIIFKSIAALGCALAALQGANAQTVRMHGAVAFSNMADAQKAAIESKSGVKIEVVANGSGRGLMDLVGGQADIALVAGPLAAVAEVMNKEKPGSLDVSQMKEILIMTSQTVIMANPGVGVKKLTDAQMSDVLTGKVTNWKEVGGADIPIKVVLPFSGDGSRIMVRNTLFPGRDYSAKAIIRNSAKDLCVVVAQLPGACSVTGKQNVEGNIIVIATDHDIMIPWSAVVKGDPAGDVKKDIDALAAILK